MKTFPTILGPDFVVKTDYYPYTESRKILAKLNRWWDHSARKDDARKDNYSLDPGLYNGLSHSLDKKLKDGNFSFVYHKKRLFAFAGFLVAGNEAWFHRYSNNPFNNYNRTGAGSTALLPLHIKWAKEKKLDFYKMSFNEHNRAMYRILERGWKPKLGLEQSHLDMGVRLMSKFEFMGQSEVNGTMQWVLSLDLNRADIKDFMLF
jgi:hypothetical protein